MAARTTGTRSANEASVSDDGYGFERLERAIEFLLEEHERLSAEKHELLGELADREQRITELEARLTRERERREVVTEGVDKIIGRLDQLRSSVGLAAEPR